MPSIMPSWRAKDRWNGFLLRDSPSSPSRSPSRSRSRSRSSHGDTGDDVNSDGDASLCHACQRIERDLVHAWRDRRREQSSFDEPLLCQIHPSLTELRNNATKGCLLCQTIRRPLMHHQFTHAGISDLELYKGPVTAKLSSVPDVVGQDFILEISVARTYDDREPLDTKKIILRLESEPPPSPMTLNLHPLSDGVLQQVRRWLDDCHTKHYDCQNLRWSQHNPTVLVEILSAKWLRLVQCADRELLPYAALSYSWGEGSDFSADQQATMDAAMTRRRDCDVAKANYSQRCDRFAVELLPATLRDAVVLVELLGIRYVWIDQLCIGDAEDWNHEASKMHEVYGNAHVTIIACATENATQGFLYQRKAWKYPVGTCQISGLHVREYDISLKEVRIHAPVFTRAWVLQEERLSRRNIYWAPQRIYWSCSDGAKTELDAKKQSSNDFKPLEKHITRELLPPQEFINMRRRGDFTRLHDEWLDLVSDFTQRKMYDPSDRFPAMSGLASQYLHAFMRQDRIVDQEYLAGLWRLSFARDLTWTVLQAQNPTQKHTNAPRWSWVSLPSSTLTETSREYSPCEYFKLLEPSRLTSDMSIQKAIERGAKVTSVRVRGRLRPFAWKTSQEIAWAKISRTDENGNECFDLSSFAGQNVHAQNHKTGQVLMCERYAYEVLGQMDYAEDHGDLREVYCLEVAKTSMLLLIKDQHVSGAYIRIGASHNYRENLFLDAMSVQELTLSGGHVSKHG